VRESFKVINFRLEAADAGLSLLPYFPPYKEWMFAGCTDFLLAGRSYTNSREKGGKKGLDFERSGT
jgi:hypothetical protein